MSWFSSAMYWGWTKLFGVPCGNYRLRPPVRSIEGMDSENFDQFTTFMHALPEVLPADAVLRIRPASRRIASEYMNLVGHVQVFPGGLLSRPTWIFLLPPSAANIARICELRHIEARFTMAMNIEALCGGEALMDWCVMPEHSPAFSAAVDVEKVRALAERCGGAISEPFDSW